MDAGERRRAIWSVLCQRRHDTIQNLAAEFNVCPRTIRYDVDALSLSHPLETVRGRYGEGVKLPDWYHPTRTTLCPEQVALLKKLAPSLQGDDLAVMNSILSQFAP